MMKHIRRVLLKQADVLEMDLLQVVDLIVAAEKQM